MSTGVGSCYPLGTGTAPPDKSFYFPVGLAVSQSGNVLYAINSDFDLQYNGGTLQSYDLHLLRDHAARSAASTDIDALRNYLGDYVDTSASTTNCPNNPPPAYRDPTLRCLPPADSTKYVRDSAVIGAFATDLQLSVATGSRLFAPVRGDASLTWADVAPDDDPNRNPAAGTPDAFAPFFIDCGTRTDNRCDPLHVAGRVDDPDNNRGIVMPGEPFGMAQTPDGNSLVITHQSDTRASLFSAGFAPGETRPSLRFIVDGLPSGGNGIAPIPYDPDAFAPCPAPTADPRDSTCAAPPHPAFLMTNRAAAQIDLLRYYSDEYARTDPASDPVPTTSSLPRPFLVHESATGITVNASGTDSRGIAIDDIERRACKARATTDADRAACARLPARMYIANRSPASLIVGDVGARGTGVSAPYSPDRVTFSKSVPLSAGPSSVYVAPIIDATGHYAQRVFIVCFDSATLFVYDPDADRIENVVRVGTGPFAMAFDPVDIDAVARRDAAPFEGDQRYPELRADLGPEALRRYRFAYIASFTNSYVQVLDLDNSRPDRATFETVVYTLGTLVIPRGTQ